MPFVKYTQSIPQAVEASERAAATVRAVRTQTGDLTFRMIFKMWTDIAQMRARWKVAKADALAGNIADVNAFLASIGGSNAATLSTELAAIDTAADAVATAMKTFFDTNPFVLIEVFDQTTPDGLVYKELDYKAFLSDPQAQTIRDAASLANLDNALTALGV